ncbi:hypothetical protein, partial [Parafrankia sp. EUN1f]|uniref:hypothetical protein n=1 Tax=Parafrankia sp. EUN1f TaxID=102897 RepID=UPI0001C43F81
GADAARSGSGVGAGVGLAGSRGPWWARSWVFWAVLGLAVAAGVATIVAAPRPRIDVFHLLQGSTSGLADGENMYRQQWGPDPVTYAHTAGGLFDVYPYLPGTSLLLAPFRWVFGDVRYGLLLALACAAVIARPHGAGRGTAGPGTDAGADTSPRVTRLLPLLLVVFPESMYALQQSWTEPLLVVALAVVVRAVTTGRTRLAVVALALALASKQHMALILPVAACWPAFGPRRTLASAGLGLAVVAPWIVAAPRDFFADAVRTNLDYPVLDHSLSLPGWAHHFGITLGFGATAAVLAGSYLLAWRARGGAPGFCAGSAVVLLGLDLMNKQTFFNHYTLPMALLVLAATGTAAARGHLVAPRQRRAQPQRATDGQRTTDGQRRVENRSNAAPS